MLSARYWLLSLETRALSRRCKTKVGAWIDGSAALTSISNKVRSTSPAVAGLAARRRYRAQAC